MSEPCSRVMATSRDMRNDRLAIGQLLGRLLREFRAELFSPAAARIPRSTRYASADLGNIGVAGVRLTDLAGRSGLDLAATSEMVDNLVLLGCLERRPDSRDGRATPIFPAGRGRSALSDVGDPVAEIEALGRHRRVRPFRRRVPDTGHLPANLTAEPRLDWSLMAPSRPSG